MDLVLKGQRALVTGGSAGIGFASAKALAKMGASVTISARGASALQMALPELPVLDPSQQHAWIAFDSADTGARTEALNSLLGNGPIQILINNSGGPAPGSVMEASSNSFEACFAQQLLAAHACAQALLPGMQASQFGRIVNIISTSVKEPLKGLGVSNTIRAAVASWSKTLAGEVAMHGITVNNVLPGYTRTARLEQIIENRVRQSGQSSDAICQEMLKEVPAQRFASPDEVAAAVAFLASPAASYITGINIPVDGGRTRSL